MKYARGAYPHHSYHFTDNFEVARFAWSTYGGFPVLEITTDRAKTDRSTGTGNVESPPFQAPVSATGGSVPGPTATAETVGWTG